MEQHLKLTALVDNNTYIDQYFLGEPGVSYYIEDDGYKVLFDLGYSDVYLRNAQKLGIDLSTVDAVVLSHGHNDHTGGLKYFPAHPKACKLVAHPQVFEKKRDGELDISIDFPEEKQNSFTTCFTAKPYALTKHLLYLGEIERTTNFENKRPVGERFDGSKWVPDFVLDDSALVYKCERGIYIITGCSHAGICNIIKYAKKVTGVDKVLGVIGGFHLMNPAAPGVQKTLDFLDNEHMEEIYPCHCTCFGAKAEIYRRMPMREVGVGLTIKW